MYQAVTSKSKNKVRVFSPFSRSPLVDSSAVESVIDLVSKFRKQLTSLYFMQSIASKEPRPVTMFTSKSRADGLKESLGTVYSYLRMNVPQ